MLEFGEPDLEVEFVVFVERDAFGPGVGTYFTVPVGDVEDAQVVVAGGCAEDSGGGRFGERGEEVHC